MKALSGLNENTFMIRPLIHKEGRRDMKYEIKGDSKQVTYESRDQLLRPPRRERDEFGGETIICQPEGRCRPISWPSTEKKEPK